MKKFLRYNIVAEKKLLNGLELEYGSEHEKYIIKLVQLKSLEDQYKKYVSSNLNINEGKKDILWVFHPEFGFLKKD